ncbi:hypothetical protein BVRB_4g095900 [Beta vulgaris subsp. vulgaris]|nr:hypothetical protein BVRB_4g095900 [Beta vulgaris subsp. vulgaris]
MNVARYKAKGDKIWYFFTPRDMFNKGKLAKRMTVNGYWKQRGASKNIEDDSGKLIGVQKTFVYYRGNAPNREKTCWLMKEFEADASSQPNKGKGVMVLDYVLCSMHKDDKLDRRKSPRKQAAEAVNNNTGNINHPSNSTMTSVASYDQEQHNHIGNHEFAQQCYFPNNTDQEVSSLQNYASMSSLWSDVSYNENNDPLEQQLMAIPQSFLNPPCSIDSNDYQPFPSYDHYPPETELNVDVETYDFYSAVPPYEKIHVSANITPP